METKISNKVLWIKVWGIAAVQGSITLTWVIYNLYFPLLLVDLGFKKELAIAILIIENLLASIIEPIFGWLSDRQQRLVGSKVPLISWGIISASVLFLIFPWLVIFNSEQFSFKWLLPIVAIIWAGAMAIFRAPTMTLLGRCATNDALPQARAGFGTGIYFAGFGIGISNFSFIFTRLKISSLSLNTIGAIACLFILCCWLIILEKTNKRIAV